jgi:hypothetical protein
VTETSRRRVLYFSTIRRICAPSRAFSSPSGRHNQTDPLPRTANFWGVILGGIHRWQYDNLTAPLAMAQLFEVGGGLAVSRFRGFLKRKIRDWMAPMERFIF